MKNSLKYLKLWQKKRSELQINDDAQPGWDQMESLLDQHMPVAKRPSVFKRLTMLPALFVAFSAAAMIYTVSNIYSLKKHKHYPAHRFHKGDPKKPGAVFTDSLNVKDTTANMHSSLLTGQGTIAKNSAKAIIDENKKKGNTPSPHANASEESSQSPDQNNQHLAGGQNSADQATAGLNRNGSVTGSLKANSASNGSFSPSGRRKNNNLLTPGIKNGSKTHGAAQINNDTTAGLNINSSQNAIKAAAVENDRQDNPVLTLPTPAFNLNPALNRIQPLILPRINLLSTQRLLTGNGQPGKNKKDKPANSKPSNLDWGILIGVNTSGSFTSKNQNSNFYGSAPVDAYFGLFASYKINSSWAVAPQIRLFSPQTINTTYSHANQSKVDSNQALSITASRKQYTVSIPVYAVYNAGNGLGFKAGPVINFPVKQTGTASVLQPYSIRSDTSYYKNISAILNATQYQQKINFGFSAGASVQFKRFIFEADYLKSLSRYGISSGLGSYKSHNGTFQVTIGFQLDKVKP